MDIIPGSVMIGFPHGGKVDADFMLSTLGLVYHDAHGRDIIKTVEGFQGLYVAQNRNNIVRAFLHRPLEYLLFLDTDVAFDKDILYQMLEVITPERPFITGLYFGHVGEGAYSLVPLWYESYGTNEFSVVKNIPVDSLVKLTACGMGCALIHRSVFEKFPETDDEYQWFGHDLMKVAGIFKRLGEDFTFCKRVRELGIDIWGHSGVALGHYKTRAETVETFMQSQKR